MSIDAILTREKYNKFSFWPMRYTDPMHSNMHEQLSKFIHENCPDFDMKNILLDDCLDEQFVIEFEGSKMIGLKPAQSTLWNLSISHEDLYYLLHPTLQYIISTRTSNNNRFNCIKISDEDVDIVTKGFKVLTRNLFNSAINPKFYWRSQLFPDLPHELSFDYEKNEIVHTPPELLFIINLIKKQPKPIPFVPALWFLRDIIEYPFPLPYQSDEEICNDESVKSYYGDTYTLECIITGKYHNIPIFHSLPNGIYTAASKSLTKKEFDSLKIIKKNYMVVLLRDDIVCAVCVNGVNYTTCDWNNTIKVTTSEIMLIVEHFTAKDYFVIKFDL